jgi:hypothetical protein
MFNPERAAVQGRMGADRYTVSYGLQMSPLKCAFLLGGYHRKGWPLKLIERQEPWRGMLGARFVDMRMSLVTLQWSGAPKLWLYDWKCGNTGGCPTSNSSKH